TLAVLLERLDPAYIHTDRSIELECTSAGGHFGVAEHNTDFLTQLIDKNNGAVGFTDHSCKLAEGLGHQTGMKAHMGIAHVSVDLRLGHKGRHRVDDDDVDRA